MDITGSANLSANNSKNTKQGFRFYKSGSSSPVPPPHRVLSNPSLVSESGESPSASVHQLRRTNSSSSSVDPKLLQIVRRITTSTPSLLSAAGGNRASQQARTNNITAVTNSVLEKHREYKRKDLGWVRSGVEGALGVLAAEAGNSSDNNSSKKRRAPTSIPIGGGLSTNTSVATQTQISTLNIQPQIIQNTII